MSSYATIADLRARFDEAEMVQMTADSGSSVVNDDRVLKALEQASNLIDAHVGAIYSRVDAVTPVIPLLVDIACDIARFRMVRFGNAPEQIAANYKEATSRLRDIAKGVIKLDQGKERLPEREGAILVESSPRQFSRTGLENY